MADNWSRKKRSEVMGKVRSTGNKSTELKLIKILRQSNIKGWRRNQALPGRPDFIFRSRRVVIFVDGCFWHGCPLCYRRPKSNQAFWDEKVRKNKKRDETVNRELREKGWNVVRIWEHELKDPDSVAQRVFDALRD